MTIPCRSSFMNLSAWSGLGHPSFPSPWHAGSSLRHLRRTYHRHTKPSSTSLSLMEFMRLIRDVTAEGRSQCHHRQGLGVRPVAARPSGSGQARFHGFYGSRTRRVSGGLRQAHPLYAPSSANPQTSSLTTATFPGPSTVHCKGILFNQGQVCCAGSRLFVQEGIFGRF